MIKKIKEQFYNLPIGVRLFLKRALLFFIGWKLLYYLVLNPTHIPDKWITDLTASGAAWVISLFHFSTRVEYKVLRDNVFMNGRNVLGIAHDCNGLELFVLYIGFLLCIPTNYKRQFAFTLMGIIEILVLNIFRCVGLVTMTYYGNHWVNFAHHYAFKMVIYLVIFLMWVLYSKKYDAKDI
ncbi:MAG: archaeosortase/exosortase family protein [Bacteroidota bacterium]